LDSTISSNSAYEIGGGIYTTGPLNLSNSTIVGNSANNSTPPPLGNIYGEGGGIFIRDLEYLPFTPTIINCTITGNSAFHLGGGIGEVGAMLPLLENTIVAGNTSTDGNNDVAGVVDSASANNLIGDGTGLLSGISNGSNGNLVGTSTAPIVP